MKYKIKVITGFRDDQFVSIGWEEAHKAYYLFTHPNERGIFNNGLALRGVDIQRIEPDYHGTMGYNPTHKLDGDDWNEIRGKGIDRKLQEICMQAQQVSRLPDPKINLTLAEAIKELPQLDSGVQKEVLQLANKFKV